MIDDCFILFPRWRQKSDIWVLHPRYLFSDTRTSRGLVIIHSDKYIFVSMEELCIIFLDITGNYSFVIRDDYYFLSWVSRVDNFINTR